MNRIVSLLMAVTLMFGSATASAAILGTYDFTGLTDLPAPASNVLAGVSLSNLTEGPGSIVNVVNTPTSRTEGDVMAFVYSATAHTTEAAAVANNQYVAFTVSPDAGYSVIYDKLVWDASASTTTTTRSITWFVRSSVDNYATTLDSITHTAIFVPYSTSLNISALGEVAGNVTLRMYWHDNNNSGGVVYTDNIQPTGTVVIPEPATMSLLGLGAVALLRRKK